MEERASKVPSHGGDAAWWEEVVDVDDDARLAEGF